MITAFIIFLFVLLGVSVYLNWNLNHKVTKLENYCSDFLNTIVDARLKIAAAKHILEESDIRGAFASDDEVGSVFKIIKFAIDELDNQLNEPTSDGKN